MHADLSHVIALERSLRDPAVRTDPEAVTALLAPDFREVGASGRVWDRAAIVAELAGELAEADAPAVRDEDMDATELALGVVLLTYVSTAGVRRAQRSSVWCRDATDGRWRLRHHQGTPAVADDRHR